MYLLELSCYRSATAGPLRTQYEGAVYHDEPLARVSADGEVRYYHTDALGSIIALTDETGAVRTQDLYDPFGNADAVGEASDNPFQYTGRENDGTGLYYYRARYYSPELQRFISEDPIRLKGGDVNFYGYVGNKSLNRRDPKGLYDEEPAEKYDSFIDCVDPERQDWCGSGWSEPFVPDMPFGADLRKACEAHDNCYGAEGANSNTPKWQCDYELRKAVWEACLNAHPNNAASCDGLALLYYGGVSLFGGDAFHDARRSLSAGMN